MLTHQCWNVSPLTAIGIVCSRGVSYHEVLAGVGVFQGEVGPNGRMVPVATGGAVVGVTVVGVTVVGVTVVGVAVVGGTVAATVVGEVGVVAATVVGTEVAALGRVVAGAAVVVGLGVVTTTGVVVVGTAGRTVLTGAGVMRRGGRWIGLQPPRATSATSEITAALPTFETKKC